MRVLILTPTAFPSVSGNAVTVERWRRALARKSVAVEVLATEGLNPDLLLEHLKRFRPDLIHTHHAFKAGALLTDSRVAPQLADVGLAISPGGTDVNEDLGTPGRREVVLRVFQLAHVIVAQSSEMACSLKKLMPSVEDRIFSVPKAVCWFGDEHYDLRGSAGCGPSDILFLLPYGIRPVKGNLECLALMKRVHEIRPAARFVAAGPALNPEYAGRFEREILKLSGFARWIATIPPAAMRSTYRASDIVLNASFSEGLSNSLMEAIAAGRPVLASDIPGNRWPVLGEDGDAPAGLLFDLRNPDDFIEKAVRLADDGAFRETFGRAALARQTAWPRVEDEAEGLIAAYRAALEKR